MTALHPHSVALIATARNDDGDRISVNCHRSAYAGVEAITEYEIVMDTQFGECASMFLTTAELRVLLKTIGGKLL